MSELLHFTLLGLAVGALYALTAQGLVLIYRGSGVVNLAQGAFAMLGAFVYYESTGSRGWPTSVGWILAIALPAILGALTHLVVMRRLRRASALVRLVSTLGLFFFLVAIGYQIWGFDSDPVRSPLPETVYKPFGKDSAITADRLWIIAIAVVVTFVLFAVFRWTRFGAATEAVAENALSASALGLSPDRIAAINWALGAALAAVAGVLIAPILFLSVDALSYTVLRGLAAALVGRFRSFWATLAGAFGIGIVESLLGNYIDHRGLFRPITSSEGLLFGQFTAASVSRSIAFLIIVIVLSVGGTALPLRHELLDRLPVLGRGTVRPFAGARRGGGNCGRRADRARHLGHGPDHQHGNGHHLPVGRHRHRLRRSGLARAGRVRRVRRVGQRPARGRARLAIPARRAHRGGRRGSGRRGRGAPRAAHARREPRRPHVRVVDHGVRARVQQRRTRRRVPRHARAAADGLRSVDRPEPRIPAATRSPSCSR